MFTFDNVKHGMDGDVPLDGHCINMDYMSAKLNETYRGFSQDRLGGRSNQWAPRMDDFQGLFHMNRHICSMDRGWSPQFPRFITKTGMKKVSIEYAVAHDDLPIICMDYEPGADGPDMMEGHNWPRTEGAHALVDATQIDDIKMIGWAEVFHHITRICPFVTMGDLGRIFNAPTDWSGQIDGSPMTALWKEAERRGAIAEVG